MPKQPPQLILTASDRTYLQAYISTGTRSARAIKRAQVLLHSEAGMSVREISQRVGVCPATIYNLRHRYAAEGVQATLAERPRPGQPRKLNLAQETQLTVLACSDAPAGHARWTIRLLADHAVEVGIVEHIAPETVRQFLKKTSLNPGANNAGASVKPMELI
jgi:putative transposase